MEHRELQDLIPAHALDALDADDALLLDGHLETCEGCLRELDTQKSRVLLELEAAHIGRAQRATR